MRRLAVVLLLPLLALGAAADDDKGWALHEWGVFTVPRSSAWAKRDLLQEWKSFPSFFYGSLPGRKLPYRGPVFKPVIWFHGATPKKVVLKLRFAEGRPLIWWPAAELPAQGLGKGDPSLLQFAIYSGSKPPMRRATELPDVPAGHWVQRLRDVGGKQLWTQAGHSRMGTQWNTERFVYYDGVMKAPKPVSAKRDGAAILLASNCAHDWQDALAIERRDGALYASSWIERIAAGKRETRIPLASIDDTKALASQLVARLTKAGLTKAEAEALSDVWRDGLFGADGLQVFYRVPRKTYDAWLPLECAPAPTRSARVGLVLHQRLEPELQPTLRALIAKLGARRFEDREAASAALARIGGAAFAELERAIASSKDPEVVRRCKAILAGLDASRLVEKPK